MSWGKDEYKKGPTSSLKKSVDYGIDYRCDDRKKVGELRCDIGAIR
jgi:hypothetical protein